MSAKELELVSPRNQNKILKTSEVPSNENTEFQYFLRLAENNGTTDLRVDTESIFVDKPGARRTIKDGTGHSVGISIDIHPKGLHPYSYYFPFRHKAHNLDHTYLDAIRNLILKRGKRISFWNAKHDLLALETFGIQGPIDFNDVMLKAHSVNENLLSYRLDYISKMHGLPGKARDKYFDMAIKLLGWDGMPPENMGEYAATDATLLRPLDDHYEAIYRKEDESDGENWSVDQQFILLLKDMEKIGAKVDLKLAEREYNRGRDRMAEIAKEIGLNPGSRDQLEELLINRLELPVVKSSGKTGKPSFDKMAMEKYEERLEELNSPVANLVLEYRGYQKATSSYWEAYLKYVSPDGRIRPNFNMHRTRTHRLSCDTPNLQQIPRVSEKPWSRSVKQGFIAEEGYELWEVDYAQLEMRLIAAYAKDRNLLEIFDDPERDLFGEMSIPLGLPRFDTKTFNYATGYGVGISKLANMLGISEADAAIIRNTYFTTWPGIKKITDMAVALCKGRGYVKTWASRRRHFENPYKESHKAFNAVMQGGAFEIVKRQMIRLAKELGTDNQECRIILQVHDSIVFEIMKGKEDFYGHIIKKVMEDVVPDFGVTFRVDWHRWGS